MSTETRERPRDAARERVRGGANAAGDVALAALIRRASDAAHARARATARAREAERLHAGAAVGTAANWPRVSRASLVAAATAAIGGGAIGGGALFAPAVAQGAVSINNNETYVLTPGTPAVLNQETTNPSPPPATVLTPQSFEGRWSELDFQGTSAALAGTLRVEGAVTLSPNVSPRVATVHAGKIRFTNGSSLSFAGSGVPGPGGIVIEAGGDLDFGMLSGGTGAMNFTQNQAGGQVPPITSFGGAISVNANGKLNVAAGIALNFGDAAVPASGNTAVDGGGAIAIRGISTVSNWADTIVTLGDAANFYGNKAQAFGADGGAVLLLSNTVVSGAATYKSSARLTIGGTVNFGSAAVVGSGNSANRDGGAIANVAEDYTNYTSNRNQVVIGSSTSSVANFYQNEAGRYGGAIYNNADSSFIIRGVANFGSAAVANSGNKAASGGAIYNTGIGFLEAANARVNALVQISGGGTFYSNQTLSGSGGAIYNDAGGKFLLTGNYYFGDAVEAGSGNTAVFNGGAIFNAGLGAGTDADSYIHFTNNNVSFYRNVATGGSGGAIHNKDGGVIRFSGLSVTFGSATVAGSGNSAGSSGGAIYNAGENSLIAVNGAAVFYRSEAQTGSGGAIYNVGNNSRITIGGAATFGTTNAGTGNTAGVSGGAIYNAGENSLIAVNGAAVFFRSEARSGSGGAIYNEAGGRILFNASNREFGSLNIADSGNVAATHGGAIYNHGLGRGGESDSYIYFAGGQNNYFYRNVARNGSGGAIFNDAGGFVRWESHAFFGAAAVTDSGNVAKGSGGALFNSGANSTLRFGWDAHFHRNVSQTGSGGAIFNAAGASVIFARAAFGSAADADSGNAAATDGGAIYNHDRGTISVNDSYFRFYRNIAKVGSGGAIFNDAGSTISVNNYVPTSFGDAAYANSGNTARNSGGAIFNAGAGSSIALNGGATFYGNTAQTGSGGAIYNAAGASISIANGQPIFRDNTAGVSGGAIYNEGGDISATGGASTFYGNTATAGSGGAIYSSGVGNVVSLHSAAFGSATAGTGNTAGQDGGAIYNNASVVTFYGGSNTFYGNVAGRSGGAIYNAGGGRVEFNNASEINFGRADDGSFPAIAGNTATGGSGGAIYNEGVGSAVLISKTGNYNFINFFDNSAASSGGAIYNKDGTVRVEARTSETQAILFKNNYVTGANARGGVIYNEKTTTGDGGRVSILNSRTSAGASSPYTAIFFSGKPGVNAGLPGDPNVSNIIEGGIIYNKGGAIDLVARAPVNAGSISQALIGFNSGATPDGVILTSANSKGGAIYSSDGGAVQIQAVSGSDTSQNVAEVAFGMDGGALAGQSRFGAKEGGVIYSNGGVLDISATTPLASGTGTDAARILLHGDDQRLAEKGGALYLGSTTGTITAESLGASTVRIHGTANATSGAGGAIYASGTTEMAVKATSGGAFALIDFTNGLTEADFKAAIAGTGGAIAAESGAKLQFAADGPAGSTVNFTGARSLGTVGAVGGGAIAAKGAGTQVDVSATSAYGIGSVFFTDNSAREFGGSIYALDGGVVNVAVHSHTTGVPSGSTGYPNPDDDDGLASGGVFFRSHATQGGVISAGRGGEVNVTVDSPNRAYIVFDVDGPSNFGTAILAEGDSAAGAGSTVNITATGKKLVTVPASIGAEYPTDSRIEFKPYAAPGTHATVPASAGGAVYANGSKVSILAANESYVTRDGARPTASVSFNTSEGGGHPAGTYFAAQDAASISQYGSLSGHTLGTQTLNLASQTGIILGRGGVFYVGNPGDQVEVIAKTAQGTATMDIYGEAQVFGGVGFAWDGSARYNDAPDADMANPSTPWGGAIILRTIVDPETQPAAFWPSRDKASLSVSGYAGYGGGSFAVRDGTLLLSSESAFVNNSLGSENHIATAAEVNIRNSDARYYGGAIYATGAPKNNPGFTGAGAEFAGAARVSVGAITAGLGANVLFEGNRVSGTTLNPSAHGGAIANVGKGNNVQIYALALGHDQGSIADVTFKANVANSGSGSAYGGAIANEGGFVNIWSHSEKEETKAFTSFTENLAHGGSGATAGGAIYNRDGTVVFGAFRNNITDPNLAAKVYQGLHPLGGTYFIGNIAWNTSGGGTSRGGAIANIADQFDATVAMDWATSLSMNKAAYGGAIANKSSLGHTALFTTVGADVPMQGTTTGPMSGGTTSSTVVFQNNEAFQGGAIWNDGSGGGDAIVKIYAGGSNKAALPDIVFGTNKAVFTTDADLNGYTGAVFNRTGEASGGAIYNNAGTVTIAAGVPGDVEKGSVLFEANSAQASGGAIWNEGNGQVTLTATLVPDASPKRPMAFIGNTAANFGGAIGNAAGAVSLTVANTTNNSLFFLDNSAARGGAIWNDNTGAPDTSVVTIFGYGLFEGNRANSGGAIWHNGAGATLHLGSVALGTQETNLTFRGNVATGAGGAGGAIYIGANADFDAIGSAFIFTRNVAGNLNVDGLASTLADRGQGGAIYYVNETKPLELRHTYFEYNGGRRGGTEGGAIYMTKGDITLAESQFINNFSSDDSAAVHIHSSAQGTQRLELHVKLEAANDPAKPDSGYTAFIGNRSVTASDPNFGLVDSYLARSILIEGRNPVFLSINTTGGGVVDMRDPMSVGRPTSSNPHPEPTQIVIAHTGAGTWKLGGYNDFTNNSPLEDPNNPSHNLPTLSIGGTVNPQTSVLQRSILYLYGPGEVTNAAVSKQFSPYATQEGMVEAGQMQFNETATVVLRTGSMIAVGGRGASYSNVNPMTGIDTGAIVSKATGPSYIDLTSTTPHISNEPFGTFIFERSTSTEKTSVGFNLANIHPQTVHHGAGLGDFDANMAPGSGYTGNTGVIGNYTGNAGGKNGDYYLPALELRGNVEWEGSVPDYLPVVDILSFNSSPAAGDRYFHLLSIPALTINGVRNEISGIYSSPGTYDANELLYIYGTKWNPIATGSRLDNKFQLWMEVRDHNNLNLNETLLEIWLEQKSADNQVAWMKPASGTTILWDVLGHNWAMDLTPNSGINGNNFTTLPSDTFVSGDIVNFGQLPGSGATYIVQMNHSSGSAGGVNEAIVAGFYFEGNNTYIFSEGGGIKGVKNESTTLTGPGVTGKLILGGHATLGLSQGETLLHRPANGGLDFYGTVDLTQTAANSFFGIGLYGGTLKVGSNVQVGTGLNMIWFWGNIDGSPAPAGRPNAAGLHFTITDGSSQALRTLEEVLKHDYIARVNPNSSVPIMRASEAGTRGAKNVLDGLLGDTANPALGTVASGDIARIVFVKNELNNYFFDSSESIKNRLVIHHSQPANLHLEDGIFVIQNTRVDQYSDDAHRNRESHPSYDATLIRYNPDTLTPISPNLVDRTTLRGGAIHIGESGMLVLSTGMLSGATSGVATWRYVENKVYADGDSRFALGGAMYVGRNALLSVDGRSVFDRNVASTSNPSAYDSYAQGGGLYVGIGGTATFWRSARFLGNESDIQNPRSTGGAIHNEGHITIYAGDTYDAAFVNNSAGGHGGAIFNQTDISTNKVIFNYHGNTFVATGNKAGTGAGAVNKAGGVIYNNSNANALANAKIFADADIHEGLLAAIRFSDNSAGGTNSKGGAIYNAGVPGGGAALPDIYGFNGGAKINIHWLGDSSTSLFHEGKSGIVFEGNKASFGGAIFNEILGTRYLGATTAALIADQPYIDLYSGAYTYYSAIRFSGNEAGIDGGAIHNGALLTLNAEFDAGAAAVYNKFNVQVINHNDASGAVWFSGNKAGGDGGAIHNSGNLYARDESSMFGKSYAFENNTAGKRGGAIFNAPLANSNPIVDFYTRNGAEGLGMTFSGNQAGLAGGTIFNSGGNNGVVAPILPGETNNAKVRIRNDFVGGDSAYDASILFTAADPADPNTLKTLSTGGFIHNEAGAITEITSNYKSGSNNAIITFGAIDISNGIAENGDRYGHGGVIFNQNNGVNPAGGNYAVQDFATSNVSITATSTARPQQELNDYFTRVSNSLLLFGSSTLGAPEKAIATQGGIIYNNGLFSGQGGRTNVEIAATASAINSRAIVTLQGSAQAPTEAGNYPDIESGGGGYSGGTIYNVNNASVSIRALGGNYTDGVLGADLDDRNKGTRTSIVTFGLQNVPNSLGTRQNPTALNYTTKGDFLGIDPGSLVVSADTDGGAIYNKYGSVDVLASNAKSAIGQEPDVAVGVAAILFNAHAGRNGGAIYSEGTLPGPNTNSGVSVYANYAGTGGTVGAVGGFTVENRSLALVLFNDLSNASAGGDGGVIYATKSGNVSVSARSASNGGPEAAINYANSVVRFGSANESHFGKLGAAGSGGVIYASENASVSVDAAIEWGFGSHRDARVEFGSLGTGDDRVRIAAGVDGGAIYATGGSRVGVRAKQEQGFESSNNFNYNLAQISVNSEATTGSGGAIYAAGGSEVAFETYFTRPPLNVGTNNTARIEIGHWDSNAANRIAVTAGQHGGAIYADGAGTRVKLEARNASGTGAHYNTAQVLVNSASGGEGGAIFVSDHAEVNILAMVQNRDYSGSSNGSSLVQIHSTAASQGGAISAYNSLVSVRAETGTDTNGIANVEFHSTAGATGGAIYAQADPQESTGILITANNQGTGANNHATVSFDHDGAGTERPKNGGAIASTGTTNAMEVAVQIGAYSAGSESSTANVLFNGLSAGQNGGSILNEYGTVEIAAATANAYSTGINPVTGLTNNNYVNTTGAFIKFDSTASEFGGAIGNFSGKINIGATYDEGSRRFTQLPVAGYFTGNGVLPIVVFSNATSESGGGANRAAAGGVLAQDSGETVIASSDVLAFAPKPPNTLYNPSLTNQAVLWYQIGTSTYMQSSARPDTNFSVVGSGGVIHNDHASVAVLAGSGEKRYWLYNVSTYAESTYSTLFVQNSARGWNGGASSDGINVGGGAIYNANSSKIILTDSNTATYKPNGTDGGGGAAHFVSNSAGDASSPASGGAIYNANDSTVEIHNRNYSFLITTGHNQRPTPEYDQRYLHGGDYTAITGLGYTAGTFAYFEGNTASASGGAIYNANGSTINIGTNDSDWGGGHYIGTNISFRYNIAGLNNSIPVISKSGGAVYLSDASLILGTPNVTLDLSFIGNSAASGGAVSIRMTKCPVAPLLNIQGDTKNNPIFFTNNKGDSDAGAIELLGDYTGGDANTKLLDLKNVEFRGNTTFNMGGAIHVGLGLGTVGHIQLENSRFFGNSVAFDSGGAIMLIRADAKFLGTNIFRANTAGLEYPTEGHGAGIALWAGAMAGPVAPSVSFTFEENKAGGYGGAIYGGSGSGWGSAAATPTDAEETARYTFRGNQAGVGSSGSGGGAIALSNAGQFRLFNAAFTGNSVVAGSGGAIYVEGADAGAGQLLISNSTFVGNSASENGGAAFLNTVSVNDLIPEFRDTSFYANTAGASGGAIYVGESTTLKVSTTAPSANLPLSGFVEFAGNTAAGTRNSIHLSSTSALAALWVDVPNGVVNMLDPMSATLGVGGSGKIVKTGTGEWRLAGKNNLPNGVEINIGGYKFNPGSAEPIFDAATPGGTLHLYRGDSTSSGSFSVETAKINLGASGGFSLAGNTTLSIGGSPKDDTEGNLIASAKIHIDRYGSGIVTMAFDFAAHHGQETISGRTTGGADPMLTLDSSALLTYNSGANVRVNLRTLLADINLPPTQSGLPALLPENPDDPKDLGGIEAGNYHLVAAGDFTAINGQVPTINGEPITSTRLNGMRIIAPSIYGGGGYDLSIPRGILRRALVWQSDKDWTSDPDRWRQWDSFETPAANTASLAAHAGDLTTPDFVRTPAPTTNQEYASGDIVLFHGGETPTDATRVAHVATGDGVSPGRIYVYAADYSGAPIDFYINNGGHTKDGITGPASIYKYGPGKLTLASSHTYTGETHIYAGGFEIQGDLRLATGDINIYNGAVLSGGAYSSATEKRDTRHYGTQTNLYGYNGDGTNNAQTPRPAPLASTLNQSILGGAVYVKGGGVLSPSGGVPWETVPVVGTPFVRTVPNNTYAHSYYRPPPTGGQQINSPTAPTPGSAQGIVLNFANNVTLAPAATLVVRVQGDNSNGYIPLDQFNFVNPNANNFVASGATIFVDLDITDPHQINNPFFRVPVVLAANIKPEDITGLRIYSKNFPGTVYAFDAAGYLYTIPEPSTYALCGGLGALALALFRRHRKRKSAKKAATAAGTGADADAK